MKVMRWSPLLEGPLAGRAEAALARVIEGLPRVDQQEVEKNAHRALYHRGLAGGAAGQAIFWAYLAHCRDDERAAQRAMSCFDRAGDELAEVAMDASLYGGIAGVGWVGEHLTGFLFEADDDDPLGDVDQALLTHLDQHPWRGHFDLVSGLVGLGVYALERQPRPAAEEIGERVVAHLAELAMEEAPGTTWFSPPDLVPAHQLEVCPQGYFNLGVAHGVPGVIAFLAGACRVGMAATTAGRLLDGAVSWLLAKRLDGAGSLFPNFICAAREPEPSRLAWCYGDPGIAAALLLAARGAGRPEWEEEALTIARTAARRTLETAGVQDHGLCHGAAGLGHLFNRICQATGDGICADAARFWFRHALAETAPGEWETGFPTVRPHPDGHLERIEETAFLTGASGVGLALLAATTAVSPDWDRALLLAIPSSLEPSEAKHDDPSLAAHSRG